MKADALILGGGVAGLSAAALLGRGGLSVRVLEQETRPFGHASGRNAAVFRQAEPDVALCQLAQRSRALYGALVGPGWLDARGGLYLARSFGPLSSIACALEEAGVGYERLEEAALAARLPPGLGATDVRAAVSCPSDGVLDLPLIAGGLQRAAEGAGAVITCGAKALGLLVERGRVTGVRLGNGERLEAGLVVLAAGAFAGELGAEAGLPLPLTPVRRHLFLLEGGAEERGWPVLWRVEDEVYLRGDARGLLASPCDEEPYPACLPPVAQAARENLDGRLCTLAPTLGTRSAREAWACLRTRTPDCAPVIGADPRAGGLYWLAGLAGWGMSVGPAAAEQLASAVLGGAPVPAAFAPGRLLCDAKA